ncbi:hypothetical protein [Mesorhizobium retamae]|uniref:Uncharacterized protein n=1 Tax=Mesorhizobium retamae TaxID=2912854 RepID=A0ABS9QCW0_9HYPH|nr:hypothetical protein [Mesorhizobium sp. IRAMC:0171]MCG7505245.1 hypothetical protein [Mesorhizobium sp. IRAMC:0171]
MGEHKETLEELLGDQIVQLVMERDGWRAEHVRLLLERARMRSGIETTIPPAHIIAKACLPQWMGG